MRASGSKPEQARLLGFLRSLKVPPDSRLSPRQMLAVRKADEPVIPRERAGRGSVLLPEHPGVPVKPPRM